MWNNFTHRFKEAVLNNKGVKLLSLLLACVSWYSIQAAISFERLIPSVPVRIDIDPEWAILDRSVGNVSVMFKGSQQDIRYLDKDQVKVVHDVRGEPLRKEMKIKLKVQDVKAPGSAARAVYIQPSEITLTLDRKGDKQIPVKVDFQGEPPEGYELDKWDVTPATIQVVGPRQRLKDINVIWTEPLDLEGQSHSFISRELPLMQPDESWMAELEPDRVEVEVNVVERSVRHEIEEVPVNVLTSPGFNFKANLLTSKVRVILKGVSEVLANLDPGAIRAYVDCSALNAPAKYDLPIKVNVPGGVTIVDVRPPSVQVDITE